MVISILKTEYLGEYKIKIIFSDNMIKTIDFKEFLSTARNPMTRKYLDTKLFQEFTFENGAISWNDYELCFPIWDLHEGKI